ncbi:MAG: YfhO family protein, partial [Alistipes sp.]|nr:YfhO family protein [Alistipes sp.]
HHETLRLRRALWRATGITSGILLIMIIGGKALGDFGMQQSGEMLTDQFKQMLQQSSANDYIKQGLHEQMAWSTASAMAEERAEAMQADAWRSLMFVLLAAVALWGYIERKVITRPAVLCAVLAIVVAADLINIDFRYLNYDNFVEALSAKIHPTEANKFILQDKDPAYRVLNLTVSPFNDATTSYFHRSVGGYHGAKLSRYQDLIDHHLSKLNDEVLDMLNVRYIINGTSAADVIKRPEANGAAWFVKNIIRADSPQQEISLLGEIETQSEAVVSEEFLPENLNLAGGSITLTEYRPNYLRYEAEAEGNAFAIFSEIYTDKGWSVTIDGKEAKPLRANYVLRAVEVPAGKHTIEWHYRAPHWALIEGITLVFSLIVLVAVVLTILIPIINAKRQKTQA